MIQFNLLPDVKIEYIKAQRRKRVILVASTVTAIAALAVFIVLFSYVRIAQKSHIANLDKDINEGVQEIQKTENLDEIITVQNQLGSLPALHDKKVFGSRFIDYLTQLTPQDITISDVDLNFDETKLEIQGNAPSLSSVNKFVDSIKAAKYTVNNPENKKGTSFSNVVLEEFKVEDQKNVVVDNGGPIAYTITMSFDSAIFQNIKDVSENKLPVELNIPAGRSGASLFAPQAESQNNQPGQR